MNTILCSGEVTGVGENSVLTVLSVNVAEGRVRIQVDNEQPMDLEGDGLVELLCAEGILTMFQKALDSESGYSVQTQARPLYNAQF